MSVLLSTKLDDDSEIPYFLWDEPMTIGELRAKLISASVEAKSRILGKVLREARDTDVWNFTSPDEVWRNWNEVSKHLGRKREFWKFLFEAWIKDGLLDEINT